MKPKIFAIDIDGTITDNKGGRVDLDALAALRYLVKLGHKVIYVTGRSSVEAYVLSVIGGKKKCIDAFEFLKTKIPEAIEKPVFPRITEMVLERNFDVNLGKKLFA